MNSQSADRWQDLFTQGAAGAPSVRQNLRVVRRDGEPFLFLPAPARLAARALALYPAQTAKARTAKKFLSLALRLGVEPLRERVELTVAADAPFAGFLAQSAGTSGLPAAGVLAGNPSALGRRFVFLVFNASGQPVAVVKAGGNEAAQQLVALEEEFLASVPAHIPGVPRVRGTLRVRGVRAFALDFFDGASPRPNDTKPLAELLNAWVAVDRRVELRQLGDWRRLTAAGKLPPMLDGLEKIQLHPALTHGDLAPWNVKVSRGRWTVLDWERAETEGVPGWDWFHFILQPAVLVRREAPAALLSRLERLLASREFSAYAQRAGLDGHSRALALAYLAYCTRVIRQTEGAAQIMALERIAGARWFPNVR